MCLFKLWPEKVDDHKRPFRERAFYPYGGFEDFLGQGSMENHQVYDAEIVKEEGDYVRVRMWTDYFGNRLEKTFTLYGNTPLLEVRFALTFKNPEANVLGTSTHPRTWRKDIGQRMSLLFRNWMACRSTGWLRMTVSDN